MLSDEMKKKLARDLVADIRQLLGSQPAAAESPGRPRLIVPEHARPALVDPTRPARERRIRFIVGRYGLWWLVEYYTEGEREIEDLPEDQLRELGRDCEKALKAVLEGVSFEDIGLVRGRDCA